MTYRGLDSGARSVAAACFRTTRWRLASVRGQERTLAALSGFRREVAARTCVRLRRETRLQLQAMRQLLHTLFDSMGRSLLRSGSNCSRTAHDCRRYAPVSARPRLSAPSPLAWCWRGQHHQEDRMARQRPRKDRQAHWIPTSRMPQELGEQGALSWASPIRRPTRGAGPVERQASIPSRCRAASSPWRVAMSRATPSSHSRHPPHPPPTRRP